jgi:hypothetical protein
LQSVTEAYFGLVRKGEARPHVANMNRINAIIQGVFVGILYALFVRGPSLRIDTHLPLVIAQGGR